ncbi:hypothetical protein GGG16DRAFT_57518 [Schizophyllum commune]
MENPRDPPASSGSKTFGIHKYNPEYCLGSGAQREYRRRGYEDKYEDDALHEELGDDARIWRVMLDEGRANDAAMLQRFRDHLDVDLVFAGLFSAVLTTFVAQTSQAPSDTGDTTIALLLELIAIQRAWANNPRVNDVASFSLPPPSPTPSPWINRCWFLSLISSLLAAFGAVVVRQWLQEYESDITGPPKRRALVRHYRRVGLKLYKVHLIVPILPMLLHVSLLLFFVGLTLYVRQSDRSMSNGVIALTAAIYLVYLVTNLLPVFLPQCPYRSPLSTGSHWIKAVITLLHTVLRRRFSVQLSQMLTSLGSCQTVLANSLRSCWLSIPITLRLCWMALCILTMFRTPAAHEWEAVLNSSDATIPDSLNSMTQASSDLSVTPLVVQASSSLPIDRPVYGDYGFKDPRSQELLRRILPWFMNVLTTRSTVFDWVPGRENELQRMACILLLVPLSWTWGTVAMTQYRTCISRVLQALTSALLELPSTPTSTTIDVATLSMTLLALGNRLDDLDRNSKLLQDSALFDTIDAAYSSLSEPPSLAALRLRPVIWHQALTYLHWSGRFIANPVHFVIALWRSAYSETPFPDDDSDRRKHLATSTRLNLQEWLYLHPDRSEMVTITMYCLLCPRSYESYGNPSYVDELSHASHFHMACHAIDLFVTEDSADGDAAFDHLVAHFTGLLLATLGYGPINSALQITRHSEISAAFKSAFLVRPGLPLAMFLKADERLPATFAVSLLSLLVKLAEAVEGLNHQDKQVASLEILCALNHHCKEYRDTLAEGFPIEYLQPGVEMILRNPQLAVLGFCDGIVGLLVTQLSKFTTYTPAPSDLPENDLTWCLYLNALCAACADSTLVGKNFSDASRTLHSALLSLSTYHDKWKSKLTRQLEQRIIPLAVALALKSTHGCKALAEWVDDLPTLVQDSNSRLEVSVPFEVRSGESLNWYHYFTSDPDKHIHVPYWHRDYVLHISELVSFEEAVERMQKTNEERAARKAQRSSRDNGAEADANDDAETASRAHGGLENQGGAERTESETTDRLRTLGAWVSTSFKTRIHGLRQVARRERPSSIALIARNVDVERDAGASLAPDSGPSGGSPPAPEMASEGERDGSSDESFITARADDEGQDGAHARDNARAMDDEQTHDGEQTPDGAPGHDEERGQAEEETYVHRSQTPEKVEVIGAREDAEHGGSTDAREIRVAGRRGEQDRDDAQGQAEEDSHAQPDDEEDSGAPGEAGKSDGH